MKKLGKFFLLVVLGLFIFTGIPHSTYAMGIKSGGLLESVLLPQQNPPGPSKKLPAIPDGAIIFGAKPYSPGLFDDVYGYFVHCSLYDAKTDTFISAMPNEGVRRETRAYWQDNYRDVAIVTVKNATPEQIAQLVAEGSTYLGKPYSFTGKEDTSSWYCSKIPWFLYYKYSNIDLDSQNHYFVTPDDIFNDSDVALLWRG